MSNMPLTDAINALIRYANETTGASDTTLSDAVESLVAGYGGGGGDRPWEAFEYVPGGPTGDIVSTVPTSTFAKFARSFWIERPHRSYTNHEVGNLNQNTCLNMSGCPNLVFICMPNFQTVWVQNQFQRNPNLETVDIYGDVIGNNCFQNDNKLTTIILRNASKIVTIANGTPSNPFVNTPFNGYNSLTGTLYVPQAQLANYQADSKWKTLIDSGTMTILPIEGSIYETQYADGTPIT